MKPYTDLTILLDRSGSMMSIKDAMEAGFDKFMETQRAVPTTRVTLVEFDAYTTAPQITFHGQQLTWPTHDQLQLHTVYQDRPVASTPKLQLNPRGNTPYYDALALTIDATGSRLKAMRPADRPEGVVFVIITDGYENASKQFTAAQVRQRVEHQTANYKWQFIFMGSNQDALAEAEKLGLDLKKSITYDATQFGTINAWQSAGQNLAAYASTVTMGKANPTATNFTSIQRSATTTNAQQAAQDTTKADTSPTP